MQYAIHCSHSLLALSAATPPFKLAHSAESWLPVTSHQPAIVLAKVRIKILQEEEEEGKKKNVAKIIRQWSSEFAKVTSSSPAHTLTAARLICSTSTVVEGRWGGRCCSSSRSFAFFPGHQLVIYQSHEFIFKCRSLNPQPNCKLQLQKFPFSGLS